MLESWLEIGRYLPKCQLQITENDIIGDLGSVALLSHNTLKWRAILGLSFMGGAGGPGNPCCVFQVCLVNFALHFQKC